MLDTKDTRSQRVRRIVIADGDCALHDDRPGIHFRHHEMNRRAVNLDAVGQCALVRVEAFVGRQQRRMDVQHPAFPLPDEPRRQQAQESGEAHEFDVVGNKRLVELALERFAVLAERLAFDGRGFDPGVTGLREAAGARDVGHHQNDFGGIVLGLRGLDQRGHVRAASRNQNGDAASCHLSPPGSGGRRRSRARRWKLRRLRPDRPRARRSARTRPSPRRVVHA